MIKVSPIKDKILVVYFDDGYIDYGPAINLKDRNSVYNYSLDISNVSKIDNYLIYNDDDKNY